MKKSRKNISKKLTKKKLRGGAEFVNESFENLEKKSIGLKFVPNFYKEKKYLKNYFRQQHMLTKLNSIQFVLGRIEGKIDNLDSRIDNLDK